MRSKLTISILTLGIVLSSVQLIYAQEWMKSLEVAKKLALTQNKMLFVMWEQSTQYELPVFIRNDQGQLIYIKDLLLNEEINTVIWDLFVPVLLNETTFEDLYEEIKEKRSYGYLELFRDDTIKIMDVNGNILNTAYVNYNYFDFQKFVSKYALDTEMLGQEFRNYKRDKDFYSVFYLGAKYVDFAAYSNSQIQPELIELSNIYLEEAQGLLDSLSEGEKSDAIQRLELVRIKQDLLLNKPKRVIRRLNRIDNSEVKDSNRSLMAFLYYTAYKLEGDVDNIQKWRAEVSLVNLKEANFIYNNINN